MKDNVTYQVIVRNAVNTKWTASVGNTSVIIPENVLEEGNYYMTINAQSIYGDVLFQNSSYCSVSNISSSSVSFYVE